MPVQGQALVLSPCSVLVSLPAGCPQPINPEPLGGGARTPGSQGHMLSPKALFRAQLSTHITSQGIVQGIYSLCVLTRGGGKPSAPFTWWEVLWSLHGDKQKPLKSLAK